MIGKDTNNRGKWKGLTAEKSAPALILVNFLGQSIAI
jgi:hypothetical protein